MFSRKTTSLTLGAVALFAVAGFQAYTMAPQSAALAASAQAAAVTATPMPGSTQMGSAETVSIQAAGAAATGTASVSVDDATAAIVLAGDSITVDGPGVTVEGSTATITAAGIYALSGSLTDGQVVVNAGDNAAVTLILNGVDIHDEDSAAIYVASAQAATIVLAEGSRNTLSDGASYVFADAVEEEPNATLFSKGDLRLEGAGALTVTANFNDGIAGKDALTIAGGTIAVTAADDGIRGKDLLVIEAGTITVDAGGDALKSDEEGDTAKGIIVIDGGDITIAAGDDGVKAESSLTVNGGSIRVDESVEGLESAVITINDGAVSVTSSDDGINISGVNDTSTQAPGGGPGAFGQAAAEYTGDYWLHIYGGTVVVNAEGDGLDANGAIDMTGGVVIVNGPVQSGNGAIDYDGTFNISGGLLVAAGSAGMAQAPSQTSAQNSVLINLPSAQAAGTLVHIADAAGSPLLTFAPAKQFQSIVVSTGGLETGTTYTVYTGGSTTGTASDGLHQDGVYTPGEQAAAFTVEGAVTTVGTATRGRMRP